MQVIRAFGECCPQRRLQAEVLFMLEKLVKIFETVRDWVLALTPSQIVSLLVLIAALYVARKVVRKGLSIALTIVAVLAGLYFLVPSIFYSIIGWLTTLF